MTRCGCFGSWGRGASSGAAGGARLDAAQQQQAPAPPPQPLTPPPKLPRTELPLSSSVDPGGGAQPLRALTFNILADGLAQHGDFVNVRVAAYSSTCLLKLRI